MPVAPGGEIIAEFREYLICLVRPRIPFDLRGTIDPSDVVQETLLCALRDLPDFEGGTAAELMGWLRTILQSRLADRFRRLKLEPRPLASAGDNSFERTSRGLGGFAGRSQSSPSARLVREEDAILVSKILANLPGAQAEAVVMKHCEGMRVQEISRHMNRTPQAVGGLLRHGMKRLRELMALEGWDHGH